MDCYAYHGNSDKALDIFTTLSQTPDTTISPIKLLHLAVCLFKAKRLDDLFKVLEFLKPLTNKSPDLDQLIDSVAWRLLVLPSDEGNLELTEKIFDCLEKSGAVNITNNMLGPLVNVHLVR